MPVAGQEYTKKLILPNYPDEAFLVLVINPKADVWEKLNMAEDKKDVAIAFYSTVIKEWNFTDAAGKILDITPENVKLALSAIDMAFIEACYQVPKGLPAEKKTS